MADTILIVDDDVVISSLLEAYLTSLSYQVKTAPSGEKCLETLKASPEIKVLIMDFQLPDGSAAELLNKVQALGLKNDLKIIIASGNEKSREIIEAEGVKADAYLLKPFTPQEIYSHLKTLTC